MAKQKQNQNQKLSPANYIRTRSRTLPIFECYITKDFDNASHMAQILISRKHTNGNITFCTYLVDLQCLGIKDTFFRFNQTEEEYGALLERMANNYPIEKVDYALVHNVIYAGLEYAEDYGFYPTKEFTATTQYFLEEDNDDIELIEIKCGLNGKPCYIPGPFENSLMIQKTLNTLNKTAGQGNFDFIHEIDFDEDYDDLYSELLDDEDFDEEEEEGEVDDDFDDYEDVSKSKEE